MLVNSNIASFYEIMQGECCWDAQLWIQLNWLTKNKGRKGTMHILKFIISIKNMNKKRKLFFLQFDSRLLLLSSFSPNRQWQETILSNRKKPWMGPVWNGGWVVLLMDRRVNEGEEKRCAECRLVTISKVSRNVPWNRPIVLLFYKKEKNDKMINAWPFVKRLKGLTKIHEAV